MPRRRPLPLIDGAALGWNLRTTRRRQRRCSLTALAALSGLDWRVIRRIERGWVPPRALVDTLARALGVTRAMLLAPIPPAAAEAVAARRAVTIAKIEADFEHATAKAAARRAQRRAMQRAAARRGIGHQALIQELLRQSPHDDETAA